MDSFLQVFIAFSGMVVIVALILVIGKVFIAQVSAVNKRSLEEMANELRKENTNLKAELASIKENLASINRMMKDID